MRTSIRQGITCMGTRRPPTAREGRARRWFGNAVLAYRSWRDPARWASAPTRSSLPSVVAANGRSRRRLLAVSIALSIALLAGGCTASAGTAASGPTSTVNPQPNTVGSEAIIWIAVSPIYTRTGTVVAASASLGGCQPPNACLHLWVSHDGGFSWSKAGGHGWTGTRPVIASDSSMHEVIFGDARSGILRSDDYGNNFRVVGSGGGNPTPQPSYSRDQAVAVAGPADYVLRGAQIEKVVGSNGVMADSSFAFGSDASGTSANAPALLAGSDPTTGDPAVETCDATLACSGATIFKDALATGAPALYLSSTFATDGTVFAQTGSGIYKSTTGGHSFTRLPVPLSQAGATSSTSMLALAPNYRETGPTRAAYVAIQNVMGSGANATSSGGVYHTTDGGETWSDVGSPSPLDGGALAVAVAPDGRLFAGYLNSQGQGAFLCSADGDRWVSSCPSTSSVAGGVPGTTGPSCATGACSATGATPPHSGASPSLQATPTAGQVAPSGAGDTSVAFMPQTALESKPERRWLEPTVAAALLVATITSLSVFLRRRRRRGAA